MTGLFIDDNYQYSGLQHPIERENINYSGFQRCIDNNYHLHWFSGPEELTSSYARVDPFEESIGTEHAEEEVIPQEENVFDTSRDITENIYDDNPAPSVDRETAGDTGPLTCLVCR